MTHASLFSGIGGFDLAAEKMGWNNLFQVEIDPFCQKVLQKNFPNAERYTDIRQFDGSTYSLRVDVLSGGFPCQPFSIAGKRNGNADERALWPEMLRVIREVQPTWVVGENVAGIISMELDTVCADLESIGYAVQAFVIPACAVNAMHRRDRVWIVAHTSGSGWEEYKPAPVTSNKGFNTRYACFNASNSDSERKLQQEGAFCNIGRRNSNSGISTTTDTMCVGRKIGRHGPKSKQEKSIGRKENDEHGNGAGGHFKSVSWQPYDQSDLLRAAYGISGRVDRRSARIKALGNAIVPQVAYNIFCGISNCG